MALAIAAGGVLAVALTAGSCKVASEVPLKTTLARRLLGIPTDAEIASYSSHSAIVACCEMRLAMIGVIIYLKEEKTCPAVAHRQAPG